MLILPCILVKFYEEKSFNIEGKVRGEIENFQGDSEEKSRKEK